MEMEIRMLPKAAADNHARQLGHHCFLDKASDWTGTICGVVCFLHHHITCIVVADDVDVAILKQ